MTATQTSIFDAPIEAGTARKGDPASSRIAAKQVRPGEAHRAILAAFVAAGGTGTLDTASDAVPHLLRSSVSRRISDMEQMRWIENTERCVPGRYGQPVSVWRVLR